MMHIVLKYILHNLGTGSSLQKQLSGPKLMGVCVRGAFGTPNLFLQPLKLATSNLVYNLGLGSSLPRNNFSDKNWRGSGLGSIEKFRTPYFFLKLLKLATSNFVHNFGLGSTLQSQKTLVPNLVGAGCATEAPQRLWVSRTLYHVPCTT